MIDLLTKVAPMHSTGTFLHMSACIILLPPEVASWAFEFAVPFHGFIKLEFQRSKRET
jgi:hypothetical protein